MKALHVLLMECVSCRPSLIPGPHYFRLAMKSWVGPGNETIVDPLHEEVMGVSCTLTLSKAVWYI